MVVPLLDLQGTDPLPDLVAALSSVGFVELANHGLDAATFLGLRTVADRFFDAPVSVKSRYAVADPLANRGFRARGSESLAYSLGHAAPPDLFESFNAGTDTPREWSDLVQQTPWPDDLVPGYRSATLAALHAFGALGTRLDTLIGAAIGVPDLAARSKQGPDMLACIDYRPGPDGAEPTLGGQLRMGAHTDYTTYTLLLADPVPGLQILSAHGEWIDVIPRPGNLLMNVGDLLAMWTNDCWPSTLHRVVPMALGAAPRRRSVAWFHYPDPDVRVAPLPHFVGEGPRHYAEVRVDQHLRGKLAAPKTNSLPTSASTTNARIDRS